MSDMTPPITTAELDELERLLAKATPGPVYPDEYEARTVENDVPIATFMAPEDFEDPDHSPEFLAELDANLGLFVVLRNLAPRLLTAARQQQEPDVHPPEPDPTNLFNRGRNNALRIVAGYLGIHGYTFMAVKNAIEARQQPPAHEQGGEELRAARLMLLALRTGVARFNHPTGEFVFDGVLYGLSDHAWARVVEVVGEARLTDAIRKAAIDNLSLSGEDLTRTLLSPEEIERSVNHIADAAGILSRPTQGGGGKAPPDHMKLLTKAYGYLSLILHRGYDTRETNRDIGQCTPDELRKVVTELEVATREAAQAASRGGEVGNG